MSADPRPELAELGVADAPGRWAELGFAVAGRDVDLGGIRVRLGEPGEGIVSWGLRGVQAAEIDGLPTLGAAGGPEARATPSRQPHPNGALGIDHLVVLTPDFDRTSAACAAAGLPLRRIRDAGGFRQGFRRLGPAILELVEARDAPAGPSRFWGLVVIVADLDALADTLGERLGAIRDAVQPGRRIATLRASAGLGPALAFMDPESA
ncbi:MAG TPA: hypothetical protein VIJ20_02575 [Solirubrobacteraceae bacterium]